MREVDGYRELQKTRSRLDTHFELAPQFFPKHGSESSVTYSVYRHDSSIELFIDLDPRTKGIKGFPLAVSITSSEVKVHYREAYVDARRYAERLERELKKPITLTTFFDRDA